MITLTRRITTCGLLVLFSVASALAQDARQLYEFKFKDPKNDGYFDTLQEKYMWFKVKKGFHMFDAYTGEAMWSQKELPDFDGKFTLLIGEKYLVYSTKKGANRLDVVTGKLDWTTTLEKLKFKDVDRSWWTDHGRLFQIKNNFTLLDLDTGEEKGSSVEFVGELWLG